VGYGRAAVVLEGDISKLTAGMMGQKWEPRWVVLTATTLDIYKVSVVGPVGTHTCVQLATHATVRSAQGR
jgi:phenolic acid decarboxylase